tara:strand:- start:222 stop:1610 length:1389 start_codon:yes stop_codon:yes gene_type:complete
LKNNFSEEFLRKSLKKLYNKVCSLPVGLSHNEVRRICALEFEKIFSNVNHILKGTENLPYESGSIFIYNHLNNDETYSLSKDFQITLDSHFISSNILNKYYKNPGNRVVRCSLDEEAFHKSYYNKFNFIRVYSQNFIPKKLSYKEIKEFNKAFYNRSIKELKRGNGVVVSPEGFSRNTEESPGEFKIGVFKLAAKMQPQPKIVPIVMVNFDKVLSKKIAKCEIIKPFKMSDYGIKNANDPEIVNFAKAFNVKYRNYVKNLLFDDLTFEKELATLDELVTKNNCSKNQLVFYGSSTIRLWRKLDAKFIKYNTINLGFGGALVSDMSKNFLRLFHKLNPKIIVLYLGGNDLNYELSPEKIYCQIQDFVGLIIKKFPETHIIYMSIKPSFERINKIDEIKKINLLMQQFCGVNKQMAYVDFYNELLKGSKPDSSFFLQDGLHLNEKGYDIIEKELSWAITKIEQV